MDKLTAIDERTIGKIHIVLIQGDRCEIRCVRLSQENQLYYNRNKQEDLLKLWDLYESNPSEFQLKY
jgi:hypothetical protein